MIKTGIKNNVIKSPMNQNKYSIKPVFTFIISERLFLKNLLDVYYHEIVCRIATAKNI